MGWAPVSWALTLFPNQTNFMMTDDPTMPEAMGEMGEMNLGGAMPGVAGGAPVMEDCVPLAALAATDESNSVETPVVGDRVSYSVDGTISRIEGDQAYITKESVNGQEIKADSAPEAAAPDSIDQLSQDAGAMDQEDGY